MVFTWFYLTFIFYFISHVRTHLHVFIFVFPFVPPITSLDHPVDSVPPVFTKVLRHPPHIIMKPRLTFTGMLKQDPHPARETGTIRDPNDPLRVVEIAITGNLPVDEDVESILIN